MLCRIITVAGARILSGFKLTNILMYHKAIFQTFDSYKSKNMRATIVFILLFLFIPSHSNSQNSTNAITTSKDSTLNSIIMSLQEQSDRSRSLLAESERNFELAGKIIDWSAMYFAMLVVFLGIAAWIGTRRFREIDTTSKEIADSYEQIQQELSRTTKLRDETQKAIETFKSEIERDKKQFMEIIYLMTQGESAFESGDLNKAIQVCERIVLLKPDFPEAHHMLGSSHSANGEYGEAIDHFKKAIALRPDYWDAYHNLGRTYRRARNWEACIMNLKKALELNPKSVRSAHNLGHTYLEMGDLESAFEWYRMSTKLDQRQDYSYGYLGMGKISLKQGEQEKASRFFQDAQKVIEKRGRKSYWNFYYLGEIALVLGDAQKAELYYKKALAMNSALETLRTIEHDLEFLRGCPNPPENLEKCLQLVHSSTATVAEQSLDEMI